MSKKSWNRGSALLVTAAFIGAVSATAAIVGAAASNLIAEAREDAARKSAVEETAHEPGTDVPELYVIPDVHVVEPNNSDEHYDNAP